MRRKQPQFGVDKSAANHLTGIGEELPKRGRRKQIDDLTLGHRRDAFVGFIENNWGTIGWELQRARTSAQVRAALLPLAGGSYHQVDPFIRSPQGNGTARECHSTQRELQAAGKQRQTAYEAEQKSRESLERILRAQQSMGDEEQRSAMREDITRRETELALAQEQHAEARQREQFLRERLLDQQACFAQEELAKFILSQRHSLKPLNFANAMAGLPEIGWRQSFKRCKDWTCPLENGSAFRQFKMLSAALAKPCDGSVSTVERIQRVLLRSKTHDHAVSDFKQYWRSLRLAIEESEQKSQHHPPLPYRIMAAYQRRIISRSALDIFLEEEERL